MFDLLRAGRVSIFVLCIAAKAITDREAIGAMPRGCHPPVIHQEHFMTTIHVNVATPEPTPGALTGEMLAVGVALRFAFVGVGAVIVGAIALIDGGMTPLNAAVLTLCGAGVALASIGYLQRWTRGLDAPAAPSVNTARVHRTSMHQPV